MKLIEVLDTEYKLFVDLDGVLADFAKAASKLMDEPFDFKHYNTDKEFRNHMWSCVNPYVKAGGPFWENMDMLPDAQVLWNYVRKYKPTILTATGRKNQENVAAQKRAWVRKHLGDYKVITVQDGADKAKHLVDNGVLIDDSPKAINPWKSSGGIGILHTSAKHSIEQLKELNL
jgi:hypothetical protein